MGQGVRGARVTVAELRELLDGREDAALVLVAWPAADGGYFCAPAGVVSALTLDVPPLVRHEAVACVVVYPAPAVRL